MSAPIPSPAAAPVPELLSVSVQLDRGSRTLLRKQARAVMRLEAAACARDAGLLEGVICLLEHCSDEIGGGLSSYWSKPVPPPQWAGQGERFCIDVSLPDLVPEDDEDGVPMELDDILFNAFGCLGPGSPVEETEVLEDRIRLAVRAPSGREALAYVRQCVDAVCDSDQEAGPPPQWEGYTAKLRRSR